MTRDEVIAWLKGLGYDERKLRNGRVVASERFEVKVGKLKLTVREITGPRKKKTAPHWVGPVYEEYPLVCSAYFKYLTFDENGMLAGAGLRMNGITKADLTVKQAQLALPEINHGQ